MAAVKAAGLVDTLASAGPFTVFAPTNDAFDRVGEIVYGCICVWLTLLPLPDPSNDAFDRVRLDHELSSEIWGLITSLL